MDKTKQEQKIPEQKFEQKRRNDINLSFIVILFGALLIVLLFSFKDWAANKRKEYNNNPINQFDSNTLNSAGNQDSNLAQVNGDQASGVEVTAVYEKDKSRNQLFFKLYFNTHAADYSGYDFQSNIVIKDSQGKEYKALSVAKEGAGHHQSIEIIFPFPSSPFNLVVKNLAGVPERIFNWQIS